MPNTGSAPGARKIVPGGEAPAGRAADRVKRSVTAGAAKSVTTSTGAGLPFLIAFLARSGAAHPGDATQSGESSSRTDAAGND
jgi:hypothetical protein